MSVATPPEARVSWRPSYRLIPSRFPTVGLYDAIADPADLDVVFAIEAVANPRLRDELGEIRLVAPEDRLSGPGATPVMAAFTHLNPEGSRFSDGSYGVYYAAHTVATAVAEVSHHRAIFLRRTAEPAIEIDLRLIGANVEATLHDLRQDDAPTLAALAAPRPRAGLGSGPAPGRSRWAAELDPDDYAASRRLGRALREAGSMGLVWPSVRDPGGVCVGLFKPKALRHARALAHVALHWDGERFSHWYEKTAPTTIDRSGRAPANTDAYN